MPSVAETLGVELLLLLLTDVSVLVLCVDCCHGELALSVSQLLRLGQVEERERTNRVSEVFVKATRLRSLLAYLGQVVGVG